VTTGIQYRIRRDKVKVAVFDVVQPERQMAAFVDDVLRSTLPTLSLDDAYSSKEQMKEDILQEVSTKMAVFGYDVTDVLITDLSPEASITRAMNEINASRRLRVAAIEKAEANKVLLIKDAEADAESKYLSGVGVARMRAAIINGFKENIDNMRDAGITPEASIHMMLTTQYFDTLQKFSDKSNAIMIPSGPGAVNDAAAQVRDGMITGGFLSPAAAPAGESMKRSSSGSRSRPSS
jgi:regulator of protease activity HflC (stomatin/prohibitin superfamily)